jgi:methylglutaconyl-CoA hydratase
MSEIRSTLRSDTDARGVATITLDRDEVRNAFDDLLVKELRAELARVAVDPAVRAVVLTGAGSAFSAGADLGHMKRIANATREENVEDASELAALMYELDTLAKPTLAKVNGAAFGGAVGLIACCDVAVAASSARFALTEVRLGLAPAVISPYVVRAIGTRQARRYFVTGETMVAAQAAAIGLVHEVAEDAALDQLADDVIDALLAGGPSATVACKHLARALGGDFNEDLRHSTAELIAELRMGPEGQEGLTAFLEKRAPDWKV